MGQFASLLHHTDAGIFCSKYWSLCLISALALLLTTLPTQFHPHRWFFFRWCCQPQSSVLLRTTKNADISLRNVTPCKKKWDLFDKYGLHRPVLGRQAHTTAQGASLTLGSNQQIRKSPSFSVRCSWPICWVLLSFLIRSPSLARLFIWESCYTLLISWFFCP